MSAVDRRDPLAELGKILDGSQVQYALIGGHAVNAWLEPRFTADVDVTVQAGPDAFTRLRAALTRAGFAVLAEHGDGQPSGPDFARFRSLDGLMTLEIQVAKTELQAEVLRRAARTPASGMLVATPEDLIVLKLIADRAKDQIDLLGLARLPRIDWAYVERWAADWQVMDRLRRLREASR